MAKKPSSPRRTARLLAEAVDQEFADRGLSHPTSERQRTATISYLEQVRTRIAIERKVQRDDVSKYAIAKCLGITPNRLSLYYVHGRTMDNKLAYRVALLLGEKPLQVIAELEADRSKRSEDRSFWHRVAQSVAGALVAVGAGITPPPASAAPHSVQASEPLCIMSNRRRRAWWIAFLPFGLDPLDELLT